jgi:hypothetical protein
MLGGPLMFDTLWLISWAAVVVLILFLMVRGFRDGLMED